jgi:hypothetical protein
MTHDLTKPDPLTVKMAAAEAGVSEAAVYSAIHRKQLRPIFPRHQQKVQITRAEFERCKKTRKSKDDTDA